VFECVRCLHEEEPSGEGVTGSVWDAKLLDFVKLFALRRREFEFELTMHTSRGVDKANAKLDAIGDATRALDEQFGYLYFCPFHALILDDRMNTLRNMFQQLVSPEQKQLSALVEAKGGVQVLRDNNKMLLDLEKSTRKSLNPSTVEGYRTRQAKRSDTEPEVDNLRDDIFEDPSTAAEKNWAVFSRKFEAQKNQIVDELTTVVQRESDRVVRELKGGAAERIRDRVGSCLLIPYLTYN
jgi:hypothetical protein